MKGLAWVGCAVLGGCDLVYGVGGRTEPDASIEPDAPPEQCPADGSYLSIQGTPARSRYRIVDTNPVQWGMAFDDCRNDTETGITHLIVFDDTIELASIQQASPVREGGTWVAWAGYARDYVGPAFEFFAVTGEPLSKASTLWGLDEPDNGGGIGGPETVVWWGNNLTGLVDGPWDWNGVEGYICECDGKPTKSIDFDIRPPP